MKVILILSTIVGLITVSNASPVVMWTQEVPLMTTLTIFLLGGYVPMIFAGWVKRERK